MRYVEFHSVNMTRLQNLGFLHPAIVCFHGLLRSTHDESTTQIEVTHDSFILYSVFTVCYDWLCECLAACNSENCTGVNCTCVFQADNQDLVASVTIISASTLPRFSLLLCVSAVDGFHDNRYFSLCCIFRYLRSGAIRGVLAKKSNNNIVRYTVNCCSWIHL